MVRCFEEEQRQRPVHEPADGRVLDQAERADPEPRQEPAARRAAQADGHAPGEGHWCLLLGVHEPLILSG